MSKKRLLSRADILGKKCKYHKDIDVPDFGGSVRIQSITSLQRAEFELMTAEQQNNPKSHMDYREKLVSWMVVDENGDALFSGDEGVKELQEMGSGVVGVLFDECITLAFPTKETLEELRKNSKGVPGDSTSGSVSS